MRYLVPARGKEARRARAQARAAVADVRKLEDQIEAAEKELQRARGGALRPRCLVRPPDLGEVDPPPRRGEGEGQGADRALGSAQLAPTRSRTVPGTGQTQSRGLAPIALLRADQQRELAGLGDQGSVRRPQLAVLVEEPVADHPVAEASQEQLVGQRERNPEMDREVDRRAPRRTRSGAATAPGTTRRRGRQGTGRRAGAPRSVPSSLRPRRSSRRRTASRRSAAASSRAG